MSIPGPRNRQKVWMDEADLFRWGLSWDLISSLHDETSIKINRKQHPLMYSGPTLFHRDDIINFMVDTHNWTVLP